MVFKLKEKQVSERELGARWDLNGIKKMLRNEYRKRTDRRKTIFIGIDAQNVFDKYYTGNSNPINDDSKWKSKLKKILLDCMNDAGFSTNSSLKNINTPVRIDYTNSYYIVKIELYPVRGI